MTEPLERPALTWLWSARIQRVDGPKPGLFALSLLHDGERGTLLIAVGPHAHGIALLQERPKGDAASSFVQRLRRLIENARLTEAHWLGGDDRHAAALRLKFSRGEASTALIADFDRKGPNLCLLGKEGQLVGAADARALKLRNLSFGKPFTPEARSRGIALIDDRQALAAAGTTLGTQRGEPRLDALKASLRSELHKAIKRVERKVSAIDGDLARSAEAPLLRRKAALLLCHLASIPRGAATILLLDENVDPPEPLQIGLDPSRDANANAQTMFERARKVERGVGIATKRLDEAKAELARLQQLEPQVLEAQDEAELEHLSPRLGKGAQAQPAGSTKQRQGPPARTPYHTFESAGGRRILVGKGAADNDTLTLTVARPHDHWLHARGVQGAHVVVPLERGATLQPEVLLDAAHLAAHFSGARGEPVTEVQHTERRYVRKPKGSAPGAVVVEREKVLRLRLEPERLARLLKD